MFSSGVITIVKTSTVLHDFLAFDVRIQSQTVTKGSIAKSARSITALTIAKPAMKVQSTCTSQEKHSFHLAHCKLNNCYKFQRIFCTLHPQGLIQESYKVKLSVKDFVSDY
jgi:hypothetical protein